MSQTDRGEHLAVIYDQEIPLLLADGTIDKLYKRYGYENRFTYSLLKSMDDKCKISDQERILLTSLK